MGCSSSRGTREELITLPGGLPKNRHNGTDILDDETAKKQKLILERGQRSMEGRQRQVWTLLGHFYCWRSCSWQQNTEVPHQQSDNAPRRAYLLEMCPTACSFLTTLRIASSMICGLISCPTHRVEKRSAFHVANAQPSYTSYPSCTETVSSSSGNSIAADCTLNLLSHALCRPLKWLNSSNHVWSVVEL